MTADEVATLAAAGRFWWKRDDELFATATRTAPQEGDVYLLDASPEWLAQWNSDWQAMADMLTPMLEEL